MYAEVGAAATRQDPRQRTRPDPGPHAPPARQLLGRDLRHDPAFFRDELERLYRENYHPIRAIDLVRRELSSVPAGETPVVLTFDDSTPRQVAFDAAGRVTRDCDCALGILQTSQASSSATGPVKSGDKLPMATVSPGALPTGHLRSRPSSATAPVLDATCPR
ncbi:hypothetical protein F1D05_38355 [Kribbella qitaiheensis]|uniref:Uncharacterized protein n=1 Tax=Kribbella qitaiheensis TaxID=1544730 RepID=A0A7G6X8X8_9ACTN|nr:hypothetical protein [Kribbella qitaiheensis]QNE22693.1 hypothetical protein F1D05_38355 [Kribbella qitaiheensis]